MAHKLLEPLAIVHTFGFFGIVYRIRASFYALSVDCQTWSKLCFVRAKSANEIVYMQIWLSKAVFPGPPGLAGLSRYICIMYEVVKTKHALLSVSTITRSVTRHGWLTADSPAMAVSLRKIVLSTNHNSSRVKACLCTILRSDNLRERLVWANFYLRCYGAIVISQYSSLLKYLRRLR